jgi:hypothetical protein
VEEAGQAIEDALAAYELEPLGTAAEPGSSATGQDGAADRSARAQ